MRLKLEICLKLCIGNLKWNLSFDWWHLSNRGMAENKVSCEIKFVEFKICWIKVVEQKLSVTG